MEICFLDKKSFNNLLCSAAHIIVVDALSVHVCWQMASNNQYALPPQSSLQKSTSGKSQLHSKQSSKGPSPENFMTIGGCFKCNTYRVTALGWLKKKERKKERKKISNSNFRPFQVCHFKIVTTHCYYYCRLGQAL